MIKFDSTSIYNRAVEILQQDVNWQAVINNSVVSALLKSNSEIGAELARYSEYLFQESKWDTAKNASSILSMANMLGYQPKRKISATGILYVSADPNIQYIGKSISTHALDSDSTYSWSTSSEAITIDPSCTITDSNGVSYVATYGILNANQKYTSIRVIQGNKKSAFINLETIRNTYTTSKLDPYLYIPVYITDCEAATTTLSKTYFRVYRIDRGSGNNYSKEEYRVVNNSMFTTSSDKDVTVYNDIYNRNLFYLKFNNDRSRGSILDISENSSTVGIKIDYIESLGASGNISNTYQNFTIQNAKRGSSLVTLYGINPNAFVDGKDEETVTSIKENAPKFYVENYTTGTVEAYENTIKNLEFSIGDITIRPKKVSVYGGSVTDTSGFTQMVTNVSFLADELEDISTAYDSDDYYKEITDTLTYYLQKIKSPQDTLNFISPTYIPFALGISCTISKEEIEDIAVLKNNVRSIVDNEFGSRSDNLDFNRNFYPTEIVTEIKNSYDEIKNINIEVEAISKLDWKDAERKNPRDGDTSSSLTIHTFRIPFEFSPIFLGNENTKGFCDYRVGSDYVMRIDFLYKKPKAFNINKDYHTMLFVKEDKSRTFDEFYILHDTTGIKWGRKQGSETFDFSKCGSDYASLVNVNNLNTDTYQYYLNRKVYTDNDFKGLINNTSSDYQSPIESHLTDLGCVDDYLIYYSANYDESSSTIGNGWIEMSFDSIYSVLNAFSNYDVTLADDLANVKLSNLKCNYDATNSTFEKFKEICSEYIEIYVEMRPIDHNIIFSSNTEEVGNSVIYIDTFDSGITSSNTENLTSVKKERMISIDYNYEV